jgi:hypothetical protein
VKTGLTLAVVMTMAVPAALGAQTNQPVTAAQEHRQDEMTVLEGTLTSSVSLAAKKVAVQVQSNTPSATLFTGQARAKGFLLEGYGVFFSVEIPALDLSVMLTVETLERNANRRNRLPQITDLPQVSSRQEIESGRSVQDVVESVMTTDPRQKYRDAVKLALMDAMLDHSKNLELGPDESLTIAARGSEAGLLPNEIFQLPTVILRVKGADLADYLAGRLTKDEARQKVEVRQF